MDRRTKSFLLLLFAIATTTRAAIILSRTGSKFSPEIVNELKDFLDLIPKATVDEIIAKHYLIDSNFREVLKYVRGTEFRELLQESQHIPDVEEILDYLHLLVPDAAAAQLLHATYVIVNSWSSDVQLLLEPQLNFVRLNEVENENVVSRGDERKVDAVQPNHSRNTKSIPLHAHHLRTFTSFVEEVLEHLPRDRYIQLINQKRQQNLAFAQFYAALRSSELRPMVDLALTSSNLTTIIKKLKSNGVDVKSLEATAFKVISWGPVPIALP